jgi:predicted GTPase
MLLLTALCLIHILPPSQNITTSRLQYLSQNTTSPPTFCSLLNQSQPSTIQIPYLPPLLNQSQPSSI